MSKFERHRPLTAGLIIIPGQDTVGEDGTVTGIAPGVSGGGTLTGLATRDSDGKRVLLSAMHVFVGSIGQGADRTFANPQGGKIVYQGNFSEAHRVGTVPDWDAANPAWIPLTRGEHDSNLGDVAYCYLDDHLAAGFLLHYEPNHGNKVIITGTVDL